ncbi:sugar diacid recognition domain-containing protein [Latilactobacillus fuchuensis]|uniref:sugar diacid recognition domain-containing protein n=1 Tax=Latilactobacillus fuchuensis TaxID=164393 RepID=UPI00046AF768|nr:sugar diacid recognition domain-containing protein [Latilactobacillus fuchuensis]
MEIEQQLAQKIVARLQREIPYNINVMNKQGVIIASGEPTRVGQLHDGAVEAIRLRQNNRILTDQPMAFYRGLICRLWFKTT